MTTASRARSNLPVPLTTFFGRQAEIGTVRAAVKAHRIVTLLGPGGVGKTRTAIEAATSLQDAFPDGVRFVALADGTDPGGVPGAILGAVAGLDAPADDPMRALAQLLGDRAVLLVLDNCEHVRPAVAECAASIVQACERVVILATSRERLGIEGERLVRLSPLPVTATDGTPEAIRMFFDRATMHAAEPSEQDLPFIERICRKLDGLPLALELAAAHMSVLGPREIAEQLEASFDVLGDPDGTGRHASLHNALEWGYRLLDSQEQTLLARLAVFTGSFSLEAAEQVCSGRGIEAASVYSILSRLVERSFLQRSLRDGRARFRFLEPVREYAYRKLAGEAADGGGTPGSTAFRRQGDVWLLGTAGGVFRLRDAKGLRYLAQLLMVPGRELFVLDLIDLVEGATPQQAAQRRSVGDAGEVVDRQAVAAYRARLSDLEQELDEAREFNDVGRVERIESERAALAAEIAGVVGLAGRQRRAGSAVERARMSVTKAIRSSIARIAQEDPELGAHLAASIRTGIHCRYAPGEGRAWDVAL